VGAIKFDKFGGQIPALDERLLPIENAVYTENAYLQAGRLEPLAADIIIHKLKNPKARYAFRVPIASPGIDNIKDSYWLEFGPVDTYVVRSPVVNQVDGGRYYWANGSSPPGYTTKDRIIINNTTPADPNGFPLILGIPRPDVAPGVTVTGGGPPTETRGYVYTWVSASFEEGQPSPPTVVTGNASGTWHIVMTAPTVPDTTDRTLTYTRIYRTVVGPDGDVGFFFVAEIPITTLTFDDTVSGDIVANSQELPSENWTPPPIDLKGMVSMPNGMIAGWRENEVWFCEPYRPHAWPAQYVVGVESPIVGLGTVDQNLMVLTSGQPYVVTGIHPAATTVRKVNPLEPCTAPGSIVSTPNGVLYTSNNGLILIGPSGGQNLTYDVVRKDEWLRLLNLNSIQGAFFMNGYYCFSAVTDGVFQYDAFQHFVEDGGFYDPPPPPPPRALDHPSPADTPDAFQGENFLGTNVGAFLASDIHLGYMTLRSDRPTFNVMTDLWTGEVLVIRDTKDDDTGLYTGKVLHVDRREYLPRQSYVWRSKIVQLLYKENYAAAKVFFDLPLGDVPPSEPTLFKMFADGHLKFTRPITKSGEIFKLPSGYKADFIQFELTGQLMIFNLQVATSARELREV
jgi:hypothetical protein